MWFIPSTKANYIPPGRCSIFGPPIFCFYFWRCGGDIPTPRIFLECGGGGGGGGRGFAMSSTKLSVNRGSRFLTPQGFPLPFLSSMAFFFFYNFFLWGRGGGVLGVASPNFGAQRGFNFRPPQCFFYTRNNFFFSNWVGVLGVTHETLSKQISL